MLVLSEHPATERVHEALQASALKLGYEHGACFVCLQETSDLALRVHEIDPWAVVALDDASIEALRAAFPGEAVGFAPDNPVNVHGYQLVAVPDFEGCFDDLAAKRIAWARMQSAAHPGSPI